MKTKIIAIAVIAFTLQTAAADTVPTRIGTTYSKKQCEKLGINWKVAYRIILSEKFDLIRLGAYWDEIETEESVYDYSDLNWQIKEAAARGIPVVLAIGMKAPRHPSFFIPEWIMRGNNILVGTDVAGDERLRKKTLGFIKKTATHYKDDPAIGFWQIESEPLDRAKGSGWFIGPSFLREEISLVKGLDKRKRPVIVTVAAYPNKILGFFRRLSTLHDPLTEGIKSGDVIGINLHQTEVYSFFGRRFFFTTTPRKAEQCAARVMAKIKNENKEAWITRLDAEPAEDIYGERAGGTIASDADPARTEETLKRIERAGADTFLLWGSEYWLYKRMKYGDTEWVSTIQRLLEESKQKKAERSEE
ncbi:MAG: beta-galactosidase [Candidatus Omnitrophota bacterium]